MQVYAAVAAHVVRLTGVGEEVGLCAGLYACLEERQTVLGHHGGVVVTRDDLQLALQVLGLGEQTGFGVSLGVGLRGVHIALAIHHLIPLPVDHRAAGNTYLEDLGVVGHQRDGHETAEAPAVHADAVAVDIRQTLQVVDTLHLVLHLDLAELTEGSLLEIPAAVLAATVVEDKEHIALLRHVGLPRTTAVVPAGIHVVGVRSAIDIHHRGVFLGGVEVVGLHHPVVQIGNAVGCLDLATLKEGHLVVFPGIGSREVVHDLSLAGVHDGDIPGHVGLLVFVEQPLAIVAEHASVVATAVVQRCALAVLDAHGEEVLLYRTHLVATDDDALLLLVES